MPKNRCQITLSLGCGSAGLSGSASVGLVGLGGLCSGIGFSFGCRYVALGLSGSGVADLQPGFNYGSVHCLIPDGGGVFF